MLQTGASEECHLSFFKEKDELHELIQTQLIEPMVKSMANKPHAEPNLIRMELIVTIKDLIDCI